MTINISIPTPQVGTSTLTSWGTYLGALGTVVWAGLSWWKGSMDPTTALGFALGAGGLGALHLHVSTRVQALVEALTSAPAPAQAQAPVPPTGVAP